MDVAVNITIDGEADLPEGTGNERASESSEPGSIKLIDRGPEVEVSHSSDREAIREIYEMIGRKVRVSSYLRAEAIQLEYRHAVLERIEPPDDGCGFGLLFEGEEDAEVFPPLTAAVDRHVENGLVVLRTASGFEMELQVLGA